MSANFLKNAGLQSRNNPADTLRIGGLTALSCSDYPGMLAAVVFCQGCPWQCGYCHNPHLIPPRSTTTLTWHDVEAFLARRHGLLDAVVFSGGEPTLQAGLADAMHIVRDLGFRIGLHTAGAYPRRLKTLLPLLDWVGMDIKAPFEDYTRTTGRPRSGDAARQSMQMILASGVAHEFRTTVDPSLLPAAQLRALMARLPQMGVRHYAVQECRTPGGTAQPGLGGEFIASLPHQFESLVIRRA
jgi:pyruvate formate lyase activating enzyme